MWGSGVNTHPPADFFPVGLPLWRGEMTLNGEFSSLISFAITGAVRMAPPNLPVDINYILSLLRADGEPRARARFLGDLGSSRCFVYSVHSSRFNSSLFPGKPVPAAPLPPCHIHFWQPGYLWSLTWPLVLHCGLSFLSNSSLPTQIRSPLRCRSRG